MKCRLRGYLCGNSDIIEYGCNAKALYRGLCSQHSRWTSRQGFYKLHPKKSEIKPHGNIENYLISLGYKKDSQYDFIWRGKND